MPAADNELPIDAVIPDILSSLETHTRLVLEAPPGAGKTTRVPPALLDTGWCDGGKILMLEPRRVAARAAAGFMARQLGENVGATVGYRIRFENRVSKSTRIEVVTEGILTRLLQNDPLLEGVAAILFDEFHERHLAGDLGLALALDVQSGLREDLRLVVMSATLDGGPLAAFLDARHISSAGRSFPVQTSHLPARRQEDLLMHAQRCIGHCLQQHPGDILVFLPGQREISTLRKRLQDAESNLQVIALYGDMPVEDQSRALTPDSEGRRRVVLATNIAESSVTLPAVRTVIDSGLAREPRLDTGSGFSRLHTIRISRASADQRAGRAGRVAEGWCYRLWPAEQQLDMARTPEIATVDLAPLALELAAWGSDELRFVDPPSPPSLAAARGLLQSIGALDDRGKLTDLGKRLPGLGTHPRLAALLLQAQPGRQQALACDLAALLDARDPLIGTGRDDLYSRWLALAGFRAKEQQAQPYGVSRAALSAIERAARQWRKRLGCQSPVDSASPRELGDLLTYAYPDRIAYRHENNPLRYKLSNGRMARLGEDSALVGEPWLVAAELRFEQKDSLVLRAAPLDEDHLHQAFPERFTDTEQVRWNAKTRALESRREQGFAGIVLQSRPGGRIDPEQAAAALTGAVADLGLSVLPFTDRLGQWRERVLCLRDWMPELGLPDLSDDALLATRQLWLTPLLQGKTRLDALTSPELQTGLQALLDWPMQQAVDREAPIRLRVPSGLERPLTYKRGSDPVLAVKLQELFGLGETPRIAGNRIPVTLHLLSPGGKPLQITRDLHSFWANTYPEVKKEMKGRYPRHPWPDDPWNATATHRAKPRR